MSDANLDARRCHACGHALTGMSFPGACPECGTTCTEQSARYLVPWTTALRRVARLAWPIAGLCAAVAYIVVDTTSELNSPKWLSMVVALSGLVLSIKTPINFHLLGRLTLMQSVPDQVRNRGGVLVLRRLGTIACILLGLAWVLAYLLLMFMYGLSDMRI